jgi:hypothetical protein
MLLLQLHTAVVQTPPHFRPLFSQPHRQPLSRLRHASYQLLKQTPLLPPGHVLAALATAPDVTLHFERGVRREDYAHV